MALRHLKFRNSHFKFTILMKNHQNQKMQKWSLLWLPPVTNHFFTISCSNVHNCFLRTDTSICDFLRADTFTILNFLRTETFICNVWFRTNWQQLANKTTTNFDDETFSKYNWSRWMAMARQYFFKQREASRFLSTATRCFTYVWKIEPQNSL